MKILIKDIPVGSQSWRGENAVIFYCVTMVTVWPVLCLQSFGEVLLLKGYEAGATKKARLCCCLCGKYCSLLLAK